MDPLIDALITQGYFIWDDFLESEEVLRLRDAIPEKWKEARIGRNDDLIKVERIRSDKIQWLQAGSHRPLMSILPKWKRFA